MSIRRRTDPLKAMRIWDSIKITLNQRNLPTYDRIARHLARVYGISEQSAQDELSSALLDGILLKTLPGKCGTEQEILSMPSETISFDDVKHDWYCCECHKAGKVDCCEQCHRVFHLECHVPENTEKKLCSFCEVRFFLFFSFYFLSFLFFFNESDFFSENKLRCFCKWRGIK